MNNFNDIFMVILVITMFALLLGMAINIGFKLFKSAKIRKKKLNTPTVTATFVVEIKEGFIDDMIEEINHMDWYKMRKFIKVETTNGIKND